MASTPSITDEATPLVATKHSQATTLPSPPVKKKFLSLDFDRIVNEYSVQTTSPQTSTPCTDVAKGISASRWLLTSLVGILTGITAITILYSVELKT